MRRFFFRLRSSLVPFGVERVAGHIDNYHGDDDADDDEDDEGASAPGSRWMGCVYA